MKSFPKSLFVAGAVVIVSSCKEKDVTEEPPVATSKSETTASLDIPTEEAKKSLLLGKSLQASDESLFAQWAQDLSRNSSEERQRIKQLGHLRRAEVLAWNISHDDLELLDAEDDPVEIQFPFFENETLTVIASEIRRFGKESVYLKGHLARDPEAKVNLSLSEQEPTAVIEGPNSLYYYEAFEGLAILREDEPGSQHSDFDCDCEVHRAGR